MLDVLVATIEHERRPGGLQYAGEHRYIYNTIAPWAAAANSLLDAAENDALFIDDDVELLPGSLDLIERYYDQADLFGINLIAPNGPQGWYTQSAGHMLIPTDDGIGLQPFNTFATSVPCLVAHAGTSCMFIKRKVIEAGIRFPTDWTGVHHEDAAFCLAAWCAGFRVARLPSVAIHYTHPIGAGVTKATRPDFHSGREKNEAHLAAWMSEHHIAERVEDGAIPLGIWRMDGTPWKLEGIHVGD